MGTCWSSLSFGASDEEDASDNRRKQSVGNTNGPAAANTTTTTATTSSVADSASGTAATLVTVKTSNKRVSSPGSKGRKKKSKDKGGMEAFQELCNALERNDPNVTSVSTFSVIQDNSVPNDGFEDFQDFARRMGPAIRHNTVVSHIDLDLTFLFDESETCVSKAAAPLIEWIQDSPSLRSVRLMRTTAFSFWPNRCFVCGPEAVIRTVLRAMAVNPHIREIYSGLFNSPWPLLTDYVMRNKLLETLWLEGTLVLPGAPESIAATAQAIETLSALKKLSLPAKEDFLPLLQFHSTLRKLRLIFAHNDPAVNAKMAAVSIAMTTCTSLTSVALVGLTMDRDCWSLVESGFRANPEIAHFQLANCVLKKEAADQLFAYFRCNDINVQPIRNLELDDHTCSAVHNAEIAKKLAEMLRGSLLDHISLSAFHLEPAGPAAFLNDLTANADEVRVKSMHVNCIKCSTLKHIGQYIPTAIHLRKLALDLNPSYWTGWKSQGGNSEVRVPNAFLWGMRRNGSLCSVQIRSKVSGFPSRKASRFIDAYTKRNRRLPEVLKNLFLRRRAAKKIHSGSPLEPLPALSLVPTLCKAAMQAERMAPNTVLRGLTAGLEEIGRSNGQSTPLNSDRAAGSTSS